MSNWYEGDIQANGIKVHYHRTGTAGKPVLLLLHGVTDSGKVWSRVAHDLADDYDIVMTDARGHGLSGDLSTGFSIPILADDAAGVIRELALGAPYLWGHSMGAITAATVAANYPDLVRAAVLEDPPLRTAAQPQVANHSGPEQERDAPRPAPPPRPSPDFRVMSPEERVAAATAMNPGWHPDEIPPWAESKAQVDPAVHRHMGSFGTYPWRDVLSRIECPVLLLTGDPERGAIVTPETAGEAARLLRNGQVARIEGAGHNIHRDRYKEAMQAVGQFLQSH